MDDRWEFEADLHDLYPDAAFDENGYLDEAYLDELDYRRYCEADYRSTRL